MYRNLREKLKPIADQLLTQSGRDGFEDDRLFAVHARLEMHNLTEGKMGNNKKAPMYQLYMWLKKLSDHRVVRLMLRARRCSSARTADDLVDAEAAYRSAETLGAHATSAKVKLDTYLERAAHEDDADAELDLDATQRELDFGGFGGYESEDWTYM